MSPVACPKKAEHTPAPRGYLQWHAWAEEQSKTHVQKRCDGCRRLAIWVPKPTTVPTDLKVETVYHAQCSRCGEQEDLDGGEYAQDPARAEQVVLEEGWERVGDRLVCRSCLADSSTHRSQSGGVSLMSEVSEACRG